MRVRRVMGMVTIVAAGLAAQMQAHAADGFAGLEQSRVAAAAMSRGGLTAYVMGSVGTSVVAPYGLGKGTFVCVEVEKAPTATAPTPSRSVVDIACGRVQVTVDPVLRTARIVGSMRSFYLGSKDKSDSRITLDVRWTGVGAMQPFAQQSQSAEAFPPFGDLSLQAGSGVLRDAVAAGSIRSARLGVVSTKSADALVGQAADAICEVFA